MSDGDEMCGRGKAGRCSGAGPGRDDGPLRCCRRVAVKQRQKVNGGKSVVAGVTESRARRRLRLLFLPAKSQILEVAWSARPDAHNEEWPLGALCSSN